MHDMVLAALIPTPFPSGSLGYHIMSQSWEEPGDEAKSDCYSLSWSLGTKLNREENPATLPPFLRIV